MTSSSRTARFFRFILASSFLLALLAALFFVADRFMSGSAGKKYQYDSEGRITRRATPGGRITQYGYDRAGRLTQVSYHRLGSITRRTYASRQAVRFEYDLAGNRVVMEDTLGKTVYSYDKQNRPTEVTTPDGNKVSYVYDPWGHIQRITLSDGYQVEYEYDLFDRLVRVDDGHSAVRYEYQGDANRVVRRLPNGISTIFEYSALGQLASIRHQKADASLIAAYRYEYNPEGRVSVVEETTPQGAATTRYEYDLMGRLIKVTPSNGSAVSYECDAMGNRKSQTDARGTISYTYDSEGRLVKVGDVRLSYDASGNLISKKDGPRSATYKYDKENRLIEVRTGGTTIRYTYDGEGNRVQREAQGKVTRYLQHLVTPLPQVVAEYDESGKLLQHYLLGSSRIARRNANGQMAYLLEDYLGSTRYVVDSVGHVLAHYTYSPFGIPTLVEGTPETEFLYTGEQWDPDAQLLYLRARYYDPQIGRFLSTDPLPGSPSDPQSFNQYAYVNNDPLNRLDPSGLQSNWLPPPPPPPPFYSDPNRDLMFLRRSWWQWQLFQPLPRPPFFMTLFLHPFRGDGRPTRRLITLSVMATGWDSTFLKLPFSPRWRSTVWLALNLGWV